MSQQHSGMSAALRFANQMSHQKYHKVPVTEGLSSYKSLTFIWIKAVSIFLLFNLFWKKDVFDTDIRLRLNQSKLSLYLCYVCLYGTLDNFLSILELGSIPSTVKICGDNCECSTTDGKNSCIMLVISLILFKNVLKLLQRSMWPTPTLANSTVQEECIWRAKQCWGLSTCSGEFTLV